MKGFEKIHWLPVSERFNQYLCSDAFKCFTGQNQANTRSSVLKLKHPVRNTYSGQKKFVLSNTNGLEQFADGAEFVEFT